VVDNGRAGRPAAIDQIPYGEASGRVFNFREGPVNTDKVVNKLHELYPLLKSEQIGVTVIPRESQWLVFFNKSGHEEAFTLPGDFIASCVEQGYCIRYRDECTQALGRLMEAVRSFKSSAAGVVAKLRHLVPELEHPEIVIAVSEEEPAWSFFMTMKGVSRPVEYKLPCEVIERCMEQGDCDDLCKASLVAYRCLMGE
jgi:hypothetical protein